MGRVGEVEFGLLSLTSSDERRDILEFNFSDSGFNDYAVHDASKPLGQHYHRQKFQTSLFLEGGGVIRTARVDKKGKIIGDIQQFKVGPGAVIRIPPHYTHRFDLTPNTRFVEFSSTPFDPDDILPCPIE